MAIVAATMLANTLPQSARAQDAPAQDAAREAPVARDGRDAEARVAFDLGRQAWDREEHAAAVEHWNQAYALSPHPELLVNIGNAWARLDERGRARAAFERYLALEDGEESQQREVRQRLRELDESEESTGASDGNEPGERLAETQAVEVQGSASSPYLLEAPLSNRLWTWVALSSAAGLGAVSAGLWVDAESSFGSMSTSCGATLEGCDNGRVDALGDQVLASQLTLGLALGTAALSVLLWLLEGPGESSDSAPNAQSISLSAAPGGVQLHF